MSERHELLLASAGTGKTFRLTHHLIDLLATGEDPGRILASTFTRKAAGEILDRVLSRLVEGATLPEKLEDLNQHLRRGALDSESCTALLAGLVRRLDRFQVRTLDAFFVHLGHLYSYDLGLPAGWTIADEHQEQRLFDEATLRMLETTPTEELVELLRSVQREEGAGRSVRNGVRRAIEEARDPFNESAPEAWEWLEVPEALEKSVLEMVLGTIEGFEVPLTQQGTQAKNWANGKANILDCLAEGNWSGLLKQGLIKKVRAGETTFDRRPIEDDLSEAIRLLCKQAAHALMKELADRNLAMRSLMERFQESLDAVKRERGLLGFEDLPRALAPDGVRGFAALEERELDLEYRLDARIDHLLLDEFQDTAPVQWRLLARLTEEILSEQTGTRSFFCVGDVKQSIYGWRSAEPRLLKGLGEWYEGQLKRETLTDNYRSSAVILDTVNRVFRRVSESRAFEGDNNEPYRRAAHAWQTDFEEHVAKQDLPGAALMVQARPHDEDEDSWEPVLELTVARVAALAAEAPDATIGVLVRSNKPIPWLLERLLARGLVASGEGGNPLTDSWGVLHFLSLLHLADHPGDSAAGFHVEHSPLWTTLSTLAGGELTSPARASSFVRERLAWESLGDFAAGFLGAVDGAEEYGDWDRHRFRQLVDLAYTHGAAGLRLAGFVQLVREAKVEDPSASGIKVMTIHASKGLEFDAVLLPELDEVLQPRGGGVLTRRPDPRERYEVCCADPGTAAAHLDERTRALHDEHKERVMEEALCVLYVAMTRARHRLELLARQPSNKMTYARLLRDRLGAGEADADGVIWRHSDGVTSWFAPDEQHEPQPAAPTPPLELAPSTSLRERPTRSPSGEEGGRELRGRALLPKPAERATTYGSLLHRWMEEVEWLDDFTLEDEHLLALAAKLEPDTAIRRRALEAWRRCLTFDEVRTCLGRPPMAGLFDAPELWRERPFAVVLEHDGQEVLWSGAFDRVVVFPDRAELVDFKTDSVEGEKLQQRVEHYRPQLEAYRKALAAMTGLAEKSIEASFLFLHGGQRVRL